MKKAIFILFSFLSLVGKVYSQKPPDSFAIPFAAFKDAVNGLNAGFIGLGYEYRPVEFLGFELSGFAGKFNHDEDLLDSANPNYGESYLYSDGNWGGFSLSSKAYLSFASETYWALYVEYYAGMYAVKAYGEGRYRGYELDASASTEMKFFHGLGFGLRINLFDKVDGLASIGGNSVDFMPAMRSIDYSVPPGVEVPTPKLDSFAVFKFGLMILLKERE
jgi:hypothetical protein